jgi:hypothetical protein
MGSDYLLNTPVKNSLKTPEVHTLFSQVFSEYSVSEESSSLLLFSRMDISGLLSPMTHTVVRKNQAPVLHMYHFTSDHSLYFKLRSALEMILTQDDSVYDANNFGEYSLYYNDAKNPHTVYLLFYIKGNIFGFEYSKSLHEEIRPLINSLAEKI